MTHLGTWQCGPRTPHATPSDALERRDVTIVRRIIRSGQREKWVVSYVDENRAALDRLCAAGFMRRRPCENRDAGGYEYMLTSNGIAAAKPNRTAKAKTSDALAARVAACSHTAPRQFDGAAYYGDDDGGAAVAVAYETCACGSTFTTDLQRVLHDDSR